MQLSRAGEDGTPLRRHLQAAAARGMPADPRLLAQAPAECALLWDAFVDLMPEHVRPSEIEAWQRLHGVRFSSWEADVLHEMRRAAEAAAARPPTGGELQ